MGQAGKRERKGKWTKEKGTWERKEGLCDKGKHFPQLPGRFSLSCVSRQEMGFMATLAAKGLGTLHILAGHTALLDNIATVLVERMGFG